MVCSYVCFSTEGTQVKTTLTALITSKYFQYSHMHDPGHADHYHIWHGLNLSHSVQDFPHVQEFPQSEIVNCTINVRKYSIMLGFLQNE